MLTHADAGTRCRRVARSYRARPEAATGEIAGDRPGGHMDDPSSEARPSHPVARRGVLRRYTLPTTLSVVAALVLAGGDGGDGLCASTPAEPIGQQPVRLSTTYALDRVNGQPLPFVREENAARRVRVLADTLRFTPAGLASDGGLTQITVLGTQAAGQAEVVTRVESPAGRRFTRTSPFTFVLSEFMGSANVPASASDGVVGQVPASLVVNPTGQGWLYLARD